MRNRKSILAAIAIAIGAFTAPAAAEINLNMAYLPYYGGLCDVDENNAVSGFCVELMTKITEMDSELSIAKSESVYDTTYALFLVEKNAVTMLMPIAEGRYSADSDIYKRAPFLNSVPVILVPSDNGNSDLPFSGINTLEDLKGKKVLCKEGSMSELAGNIAAYNSTHAEKPLDFSLEEGYLGYYNYEALLYPLLSAEASAVLLPMEKAAVFVKNEPDRFNIIEIPDADQLCVYSYWIDYLVDNPDYNPEDAAARTTVMEKIDAGLEALIADGTYAKLCEEYLGADLTPYYGPVETSSENNIDEPGQIENTDAADEAAVPAEEVPAQEAAGAVYTDRETVKLVQEALNNAGYNCGTPDGIAGNNTNQAIISFKAANGLEESSDITDALLSALGIASSDESSDSAAAVSESADAQVYDAAADDSSEGSDFNSTGFDESMYEGTWYTIERLSAEAPAYEIYIPADWTASDLTAEYAEASVNGQFVQFIMPEEFARFQFLLGVTSTEVFLESFGVEDVQLLSAGMETISINGIDDILYLGLYYPNSDSYSDLMYIIDEADAVLIGGSYDNTVGGSDGAGVETIMRISRNILHSLRIAGTEEAQ